MSEDNIHNFGHQEVVTDPKIEEIQIQREGMEIGFLRNLERWKQHCEKLNSWKEEFAERFQGLKGKTMGESQQEEKEINEEIFKNNYKDTEFGSTIHQSDGYKTYFGENRETVGHEQEESKFSEEY